MPIKKAAVTVPARSIDPNITPLEYMLQVLRDPGSTDEERRWAASQAAPFCHETLTSIDHTGDVVLRHDDPLDELN